jgi:predicted aldo/keto reductase-like oxidoreductase
MLYHNFKGDKLPALGMGTMRLPLLDNDNSHIDEEKTAEMVEYAMKNGVNYFDTAYMYHGGESENVMGRVLSKYPRESFFLADKFPGFDEKSLSRVSEIFEDQLKKCKTEYFDYYLIHCVCDTNIDLYLDESYGLVPYLLEQKKNGRIRHLGFSEHASVADLERFLKKYGKDMEFCQIQLNYLDYTYQNAKGQIELLNKYNLPVWVMEPLRGGKLANVSDEYKAVMKSLREDETPHSFAFRFIQSIPEVVVTLSGMSNFSQVEDNIKIFSEHKPLNSAEREALDKVALKMVKEIATPCTACRYCTEHCPKNLDIPTLLSLYGKDETPKENGPENCIGCKSCEKVCPQGIKISEVMTDFATRLENA